MSEFQRFLAEANHALRGVQTRGYVDTLDSLLREHVATQEQQQEVAEALLARVLSRSQSKLYITR